MCSQATSTRNIYSDEEAQCESLMTPAEKKILHKLASANGTIDLVLQLPDPRLRFSLPKKNTVEPRLSYSSSMCMSPPATAPAGIPTAPALLSPQSINSETTKTRRHTFSDSSQALLIAMSEFMDRRRSSCVNSSNSMHVHNKEKDADVAAADNDAGEKDTCKQTNEPQNDAPNGLGVHMPSPDSTSSSIVYVSPPLTPAPPAPAAASITKDVADVEQHIVSEPTTVTTTSNDPVLNNEEEEEDIEIVVVDGDEDYQYIDDIESIDFTQVSAVSPRTLASPCGSSDYEFVPPSPSITSLCDLTGSITLSRTSSFAGSTTQSPRQPFAKVLKSSSSPGGMTGSSLFSPPPSMTYHKKYFETHHPSQQHLPISHSNYSSNGISGSGRSRGRRGGRQQLNV